MVVALGNIELACRNIQKGYGCAPTEIYGCEESIFFCGQDIVAQHHTRSDQFDNASLDQTLSQLGILQLLADGYTLASTHQLGKVGVDGVVRKARQLDRCGRAVGTLGKCYAEDCRSLDGVVAEGFVEVAHTEEQDSIRVLGLEVVILLHQGGLYIFFLDSHRL